MRAKDAHRLAGLDEQRLVVLERAQLAHDRVERLPGARRAAGAAVDDEVVGPLGNVGVEVVHQHPQRRLLRPALAGELGAARSVDGAGTHSRLPIASSTAASSAPDATSRSAVGQLRRQEAVGARGRGPPPAARPARRRWPDAGCSGARRSSARAAQVSSTARMRPRLATTGAACGPRPSPSTRGPPASRWWAASRRWRARRAGGSRRPCRLRVVGDHHAAVDAGVVGEERRQAVRAGGVEQAVGAALGDRADLGRGDGEEVADEAERRAVEVAARLDPAVGQDHRVVDGRAQLDRGHARACATVSRAAPCTWGVQRSE